MQLYWSLKHFCHSINVSLNSQFCLALVLLLLTFFFRRFELTYNMKCKLNFCFLFLKVLRDNIVLISLLLENYFFYNLSRLMTVLVS